MKKKLLASLLADGVLFMGASPVLAADTAVEQVEDFSGEGEQEATVSLTIAPEYTVKIPSSISATGTASSMKDIEFVIEANIASLPAGKNLQVSATPSQLELKDELGGPSLATLNFGNNDPGIVIFIPEVGTEGNLYYSEPMIFPLGDTVISSTYSGTILFDISFAE